MKIGFLLRDTFLDVFRVFLLSCAFLIVMSIYPSMAFAERDNAVVIEHLRLHVPQENKNAWIRAEKESWGPWLVKQKGFLGRQLLWDPKKQEAIVLITWASRDQWKAISEEEIRATQEYFEELARNETGFIQGNPFPLEYEGELYLQ